MRVTQKTIAFPTTQTCYCSGNVDNSLNPAAFADVTGMSFAVKAAVVYHFEFNILWQSAAATTGGAFSVNGPASPTFLEYCLVGQTTANAFQSKTGTAYDTITAMSTGPGATTMLAKLVGTIQPSVDGTLILRSKSELDSSAVTVRKGSCGILRIVG